MAKPLCKPKAGVTERVRWWGPMLLESSAGPSASAFAAPAAPPDHWCFITEKAEGPRKAVFSTTVHTPSVPSHPEAQRLLQEQNILPQLEDLPPQCSEPLQAP